MIVGAGDLENETGEEVGQKHEKPHRKREPQDERDRGEDVHGVDLELLPHPLVELGGLGIISEDLGGAHEHSHAHEELRDEIDHPSHEGQSEKDAALRSVLDALRLHGDLAGLGAHGSRHGGAPLHHDALEHRLSADVGAPDDLAGLLFMLSRALRAVGT